jgi:hypothetical protein
MKTFLLFALASAATLVLGCGAPQGPHVRFAHSSMQEIEAARSDGRVIWYDFEAGDEVPLMFGLVGVSEAISPQPARWVARRAFSVVVFPDGTTMFSFDGHSLTNATFAARWSIGLDADAQGPSGAILLFIGEQQDLPAELQH